jgi:23S rRNA (adenine2503-C2)-methyltransferase
MSKTSAAALPAAPARDARTIWWEGRTSERGSDDIAKTLGLAPYRLKQIYRGATKELHPGLGALTVLPRDVRDRLADRLPFSSLTLAAKETSGDGQTSKYLFTLRGGNQVEAVLMRHRGGRTTACISSQAGCALRCDFCATGQGGFSRNMSAVEIFDQVTFLAQDARAEEKALTNVVFMGMGEPFLNYDAVMNGIALLNDPEGFGLGARRMTVSTAGVVPGIERFTAEGIQVNLAISLHAADDELRTRLMPINKKWPITALMKAVTRYVERTRRKVFYEYLMLAGVNDRLEDARRLADLLGGPLHHVNLIPYNATDAPYRRSTPMQVQRFADLLKERRVPTTIRHTMGDDIAAACGQLRVDKQSP